MDYRPYILAGTFLLLVVAVITFGVTLIRSRSRRALADRYSYVSPETAGPSRADQPIDTSLAGLEVTVDAEAPSAALLTPLRTGEWMPPESPAPAASLGGVSLDERIADFHPVPDVREPAFNTDAYPEWEVAPEATLPAPSANAPDWAANVPAVLGQEASESGDDFSAEIRALLPTTEFDAVSADTGDESRFETPQPPASAAGAQPEAVPPAVAQAPAEPQPPTAEQPESRPQPSTPQPQAPAPQSQEPSVQQASALPTVPLLPATGVVPSALVPQSVPVIEAPALVVPPAVTIDPALLAKAIAEASAAAVAAAQASVVTPAAVEPSSSAEIAPAEPVIDFGPVMAAARPQTEPVPATAPAAVPVEPARPVPVPVSPATAPASAAVPAAEPTTVPSPELAGEQVPSASTQVDTATPVEDVQEWIAELRGTQGEPVRPTAVAQPASPRPTATVAAPPPAPPAAEPEPEPPQPARKARPSVRVHGVEQAGEAVEGEPVRLAPAPRTATSREQVEDIVMAAPVEMWFGDARVGVKAGSATYDRFRKYADVLLDDLKELRSQSR